MFTFLFFPKQVRFGVLSSEKSWAAVAGWVGRGNGAGLPLGSVHVSCLGSWVGWVGRGDGAGFSLAPFMFPFSACGQGAGIPLTSLHVSFLGSWVGWVRGPFMFPSFWVLGRTGGPLHWAPFIFPFWAPGSDGWAAAMRSWARIGLPSYCLSGLLGRMGSPRPRSWAPVGLPSSSFCVLGRMGGPRQKIWSLVGLASFFLSGLLGRTKKLGSSWAPFMFPSFWTPGSDGWAAAKKLGSHWAPFIWALVGLPFMFPSFWVLGRMGGKEAGLPLGSLHTSFLSSWVGWVVCGQGWAFVGRMGGPRARVGLPSCFLSGVLGRMGWPRPRH